MTEMGVPVIITDAQLAPEPVDHPLLFSPHAPAPAPLLSDVELRPAIGSLPVQVAMNEVAMPRLQVQPIVAPVNDQPVKILITRRAQRETIIDLQTYLAELGLAVGNADGYLGPATVQAIGEFKKQHPMSPDAAKSLISDDLLRAVYSAAGKGEPPNGVIMVRQGFQQVFEAPVTIAQPELALGTHFFSAHEVNFEDGTTEWLGVTLPNTLTSQTMKRLGISTMESSIISGTPILNALGRITIPDDTRQRIDSMLTPGSTLTISDTGVGPETGQGTDFITLTRG
jgi:hypothetical protein